MEHNRGQRHSDGNGYGRGRDSSSSTSSSNRHRYRNDDPQSSTNERHGERDPRRDRSTSHRESSSQRQSSSNRHGHSTDVGSSRRTATCSNNRETGEEPPPRRARINSTEVLNTQGALNIQVSNQQQEQPNAGSVVQIQVPGPSTLQYEIVGSGIPNTEDVARRRRARFVRRPQRSAEEFYDIIDTRNKKSKQGSDNKAFRVLLVSNYFQLQLRDKSKWKLYHYHVEAKAAKLVLQFEIPTSDQKYMLDFHRDKFGTYISDGNSLWTLRPLLKSGESSLVLQSTKNMKIDKEWTPIKFDLTIRPVNELESSDVHCLQIYNILFRKCLSLLKLQEIGRIYCDSSKAIELRHHNLHIWPGFLSSTRNHENGLLLNVEICHKVMRQDTTLHIIKSVAGPEKQDFNSEDLQTRIKNALVRCTVITKYNDKTYRIDDINFHKTPLSTFKYGFGDTQREMTYADYYQEQHKTAIYDMNQPLLASNPKKKEFHRGSKNTVYLIPELCLMTGLNDEHRRDFNLMRELASKTKQQPTEKINGIRDFMQRLVQNKKVQEELTKWDINYSPVPVSFEGRLIGMEKILFRNQAEIINYEKGDWTSQMRNQRMFTSVNLLGDWILIVDQKSFVGIDNLVRTINRVGNGFGISINAPLEIIRTSKPDVEGFSIAVKQGLSNYKARIKLVFVVLPSARIEIYSAVKKICCGYGVPSQCFLSKQLEKPHALMSVVSKLVVQMNAKLGGEPWCVKSPSTGLMVVGYDIHHSGKRGPNQPSYAALVASMNKTISQFYSAVHCLEDRENISGQLCGEMTKCLHAYKRRNNGALPDRIFMYRDGVGNGQLKYVIDTELGAIQDCFKSVYGDQPPPKLTYIIVTKKINARLFQKYQREDNFVNPAPGTIVDDVITLPERFDFYLISQNAREGTVSPTSYNVILDQSGLDADKVQRFTYKMCHLYFNWSGTIAVPAVCQYAKKFAYMKGTALRDSEIQERLNDTLWYL